jgi:hypothetical protein
MQMAVTSAVPFLAGTPINDAVSADFCSSTQCAANVAGDRRRGDQIGRSTSVHGTNAKCRPRAAMSEIGAKAEDIYSG